MLYNHAFLLHAPIAEKNAFGEIIENKGAPIFLKNISFAVAKSTQHMELEYKNL